nr:reverse transcriptase domain-containing protein [Tanacetum cinerariifolium]
PRRQSNDQSSNLNNSYRNHRGDWGNDKYTPLTKTSKEILATEGTSFPKPPPMRTLKERRVRNGYCEYHGQKGHTTNECVQLHQLIYKLVKEGRLDHLVKNIKEGKDKQKSGGHLRHTMALLEDQEYQQYARNLDIFAWEPKHMTGVPRSIIEHKLKIRQGYSPVRQKKRGQAPEHAKAILEEVHKLVDA